MSVPVMTQQKLFGLFEIDAAGTVLYSRAETEGGAGVAGQHWAGLNFYDEVAPFANVDEFRRRIGNFADGRSQADNFSFTCDYENGPQPVRVLLARMRSGGRSPDSILLHIRKA